MKKFYIAGPMSGYPDFNMHEFDRVAAILRQKGYEVVNPVDFDREEGVELQGKCNLKDLDITAEQFKRIIKRDLEAVLDCTDIILLGGYEHSVGAKAELSVAEWMGLRKWKVYDLPRITSYES